MPRSKQVTMRNPKDLVPHPKNRELYGPPEENEQYENMVRQMKRGYYDEDYPLTITPDDRVLCGCTRCAAALKARLPEVPCRVFTAVSPTTAEAEYIQVLLFDNRGRTKSKLMLAREWRLEMITQKELARRRMAEGGGGGVGGDETGKASDLVGQKYAVGGKTVERYLKVLDAIDAAAAADDTAEAQRLTRLLE